MSSYGLSRVRPRASDRRAAARDRWQRRRAHS